jgi:hypothetical protein
MFLTLHQVTQSLLKRLDSTGKAKSFPGVVQVFPTRIPKFPRHPSNNILFLAKLKLLPVTIWKTETNSPCQRKMAR